jgi:hypothetical protein
MAYSIHIERASDGSRPALSIEEWSATAAKRGDLRIQDKLSATNPATGQVIEVPGPFWVWSGHSSAREVALRFAHGRVSTDRPDEETIDLMIVLAQELGAEVRGDEGEVYEATHLSITGNGPEGGAPRTAPARGGKKRPWWKLW